MTPRAQRRSASIRLFLFSLLHLEGLEKKSPYVHARAFARQVERRRARADGKAGGKRARGLPALLKPGRSSPSHTRGKSVCKPAGRGERR